MFCLSVIHHDCKNGFNDKKYEKYQQQQQQQQQQTTAHTIRKQTSLMC